MAEKGKANSRKFAPRHRDRISQTVIYLGKLVRMFLFQNDWKVLPLSAAIAYMVAIVIRNDCFLTREGSLKGALALTCVAMWNGCFNSIQVICRERAIVKREHRSGMHVSSYTFAHAIYQAVLCAVQAAITVYICRFAGVNLPAEGIASASAAMDIGLTLFFITFAADMLSLFISSIVHTTTAAMTVMPFLLIFQLVFSGGVFPVPQKLTPVSHYTLSSYGIKCLAAQADYNNLPMVTGWNTISKMRNSEIQGSYTVDSLLEEIKKGDFKPAADLRDSPVSEAMTVGDVIRFMQLDPGYKDVKDKTVDFSFTIGELIDYIGEDTAKEIVLEKTGDASYNSDYEANWTNVLTCWGMLCLMALLYLLFTMVALKFIDKDKR